MDVTEGVRWFEEMENIFKNDVKYRINLPERRSTRVPGLRELGPRAGYGELDRPSRPSNCIAPTVRVRPES